jgi:Inner membrane component of T3SS, cytoplasmic domain
MDASPAPAELRGLVVQSGDQAGTWQPVRSPVTLVGRAPGCDILVARHAVRLLHCVLAPDDDGIAVRAITAGGVQVNGQAATTAVLRDGDTLTIGPVEYCVRWPSVTPAHDPAVEALRIQTAALVAQQAALFERELRAQKREVALAQQEEQLAAHLEVKRRQLLDLQDQITDARENLRQKRAALADIAKKQSRNLAVARAEAANLLGQAKAERQRLATLQRRLKQRWHRERHAERTALAAAEAQLAEERRQVAAERDRLSENAARQIGEIELDKRRLKDAWARFGCERKDWQKRHAADLADLHQKWRDLARRDKAVAAAEAQRKAIQAQHEKDIIERRHEIEHLETRIGHARQRMLDVQAGLLDSRPAGAPILPPTTEPTQTTMAPEERCVPDPRWIGIAQVAIELADQRLWLSEQMARLEHARREWIAEREGATVELRELTRALQEKEQSLNRRTNELAAAQQRSQTKRETLAQMQLQLEAEQARRDAALTEWRGDLDRRTSELLARERDLKRRELQINDVLRLWGRRQRAAIEQLNRDCRACAAERSEWAAARDAWLRMSEQVVAQRRALAQRMLALEQSQEEWLGDTRNSALARKRLERLERHWVSRFDADVRELDRLRDTLCAEAARLDESADRIRRDRIATAEQLAAADERAAILEAEQAALTAERVRLAESADTHQARRHVAESQVEELRNEVERMARLLIDAPAPLVRAA